MTSPTFRFAYVTFTFLGAVLLVIPFTFPHQSAEKQAPAKAFSTLKPSATFTIGKNADWVTTGADSVWVAGTGPFTVQRIDPKLNTVIARIELPGEACSGIAFGFNSVWVPICGKPNSLARVDVRTNTLAILGIGPAGEEGGIAVSGDSVWVVSDDSGLLNRINPRSNTIRQKIQLPAGSYNPIYSRDRIWITTPQSNSVTVINALTGAVIKTIAVGPQPRFLTAGAGSIWTLNQKDGSISRVDEKTLIVTATIKAGVPGKGGDIAYGAGSAWATVFDTPLIRIDAQSNRTVEKWTGPGGDSLRVAFNSIWITDYRKGLLERIPLEEVLRRGKK